MYMPIRKISILPIKGGLHTKVVYTLLWSWCFLLKQNYCYI